MYPGSLGFEGADHVNAMSPAHVQPGTFVQCYACRFLSKIHQIINIINICLLFALALHSQNKTLIKKKQSNLRTSLEV